MAKIEIKKEAEKEAVLNAYKNAPAEGKEVLTILFGKEVFNIGILERVNTLEDVFEIIKPDPEERMLLNYVGFSDRLIGAKNFMLAEMIAEVLNEGWVADYADVNQSKWWGWFDGRGGFAFSRSTHGNWYSDTDVGARLVFRDEKTLLHAVKTFPEVYKSIMQKTTNRIKHAGPRL